MSQNIRSSHEGSVARITLDRPPLNVLTTEMMSALAAALERAGASRDIRLVRIDAVGKAFSAGVDVADHIGPRLNAMMEALLYLFDVLERIPQPTVAVVPGAALGGGCELVLGCDLCLASDAASFGQPEVRLGVFAPPASVLLPRIVGERRALCLLLTGDAIPADEAERIGLVNRVFPEKDFARQTDAWLGRLLELPGQALRFAKRAVALARELPGEQAHGELHRIYLEELMQTSDAHEGLHAFMEKRAPVWKHF